MRIAIAPPKSGLQDYIDWLSLHFSISVLEPDEDLKDYQGLVLTGGADIGKNPERDRIEKYYLDRALFLGIPVLGVCRGMQLVNVYLGGTLLQDIEETVCNHGLDRELLSKDGMKISTMPSSFHEVFFENTVIRVNSRHHQAIDKLADSLNSVGVATDGIIEMASNGQFILVQWHPERPEVRNSMCSTMVIEKFKELLSEKANQDKAKHSQA
jgi:gamma-glutamyl-gamma-aminobutyrate hydrolase PuuD